MSYQDDYKDYYLICADVQKPIGRRRMLPASTRLGEVITGTGTVWNGCIQAVPGPQFSMLYDVHLRQR